MLSARSNIKNSIVFHLRDFFFGIFTTLLFKKTLFFGTALEASSANK